LIHILTLLICVLSVEIFFRSNFILILFSLLKVTKKVISILPQESISDHWKEKVIPAYALKMMKYSLQMLLILLSILSLFLVANYLLKDFLTFSLSLIGIIEALGFAFGYLYLKKFAYNE